MNFKCVVVVAKYKLDNSQRITACKNLFNPQSQMVNSPLLGLFLLHLVNADLPGLLDLDGLADLGGDRPALALGLAGADLLGYLLALLGQGILALLLGEGDALLLPLDAADLLGQLLARLVAALGQGNLHLRAHLGAGLAHVLLDVLADLLGLVVADVLPDGSADLLLAALLGSLDSDGLLGSDLGRSLDAKDLVEDGPLLPPLLVFPLLAGLDSLALLLLDLPADLLSGRVAHVLSDEVAHLGGVALGLHPGHAVGPAALLHLHGAVRNGDRDALLGLDQLALLGLDMAALLVPDGLAVVDGLIFALVVVLSVAHLVSDFVNDVSALQLFPLLVGLVAFLEIVAFGQGQKQPQQADKHFNIGHFEIM